MHEEQFLKAGDIFEKKEATGFWQDKQPQPRLTAASSEPATARPVAVGGKGGIATAAEAAAAHKPQTPPAVERRVQHGSEKRQTDQVTGRVRHDIKTQLLKMAKANGWTESKIVAVACEAYLEQDLGEKFGVRLAAKVTEAIEKGLQKHSNREAYLSVHGYYAAEESRIINTKVLSYLFGEDTQLYNQTVAQARKLAYANIKRPLEEKE